MNVADAPKLGRLEENTCVFRTVSRASFHAEIVYEVMVLPPSLTGAVKVTDAEVELTVEALPMLGEPGTLVEFITRLGAVPP